MTKHLESMKRAAIGGAGKSRPTCPPKAEGRRRKGWTSERRARQAALIRGWQPWRRSTGPKTDAGKARCAMNGLTHGGRSRAHIQEMRRVRCAIRLAAYNVERLRAFIRLRDARPHIRIKPLAAPKLLRSEGGAYAKLLLARRAHRLATCPPWPSRSRMV